ncbi:hypothetical protein ACIGEP_13160 [Microbacterium sp. NPDC077663]|uniref:hypothetical protein n=1 Tax=Microbacterium sp. NPDC077663 TaxID=3364189 RepID=UPI0037C94D55
MVNVSTGPCERCLLAPLYRADRVRRFGVRIQDGASAYVFEWTSATEANYGPEAITVHDDRIVVRYRDASLGLDAIGTIRAFSHINGNDVQANLPVTLLR